VGTAGDSVLAEFERDIIRHRVRAGLENAKRNRPPRNAIVRLREKAKELKEQGLSFRKRAKTLDLHEATIQFRFKKERGRRLSRSH
jgi:DNA invertase Pin-like site-specific DNA recombinase